MAVNAGHLVWSWYRAGAHALSQTGRRGRRYAQQLWLLWGCRQLEQSLRTLALATCMFIALQLAHLAQSLATIAQAQAISGFAVMRSLQAHASRVDAATTAPATVAVAPASAIDPARLEATAVTTAVAHGR